MVNLYGTKENICVLTEATVMFYDSGGWMCDGQLNRQERYKRSARARSR